ncbi:MAG: BrnA antitoxin family protein [Gammaproteobacteria bacterium]|nr:BrnA antitoxin family protein [Gammaproteobacteria bacterium]MDH5651945.1 BrnA antitoxin family protein [Gammaproteobacteria bacterium]
MKLSVEEFRNWEHKSITLLGMSGVGKTRLANLLRKRNWFHYSGDYRIGTRYLDEPILDNIKQQAMQVPFLRELLRSDSIYIHNNITVDNLKPVASFLGMLGNPEQGGLELEEFKRRQALHHLAEVATMRDVPEFINKAHLIYGYKHFINDAGGSVCELDDPDVMKLLFQHTLILYIKASDSDEQALIQRAEHDPKPLYYREEFLTVELGNYMQEFNLPYVAMIEPRDFVRWIFPRLFRARIPRYEAIAEKYGYTITTAELAAVNSEQDFVRLLETAIQRQA